MSAGTTPTKPRRDKMDRYYVGCHVRHAKVKDSRPQTHYQINGKKAKWDGTQSKPPQSDQP